MRVFLALLCWASLPARAYNSGRNTKYCVRTLAGGLGNGTAGFADGLGAASGIDLRGVSLRAAPTSVALFRQPSGIAIDGLGRFALVADYKNHVLRRLDLDPINGGAVGAPLVTTLAGLAGVPSDYSTMVGAATVEHRGSADGVGAAARFNHPSAIAIAPASAGSWALVTEYYNHAVRRVDLASAAVTTVAGVGGFFSSGTADGVGKAARFNHPAGVALDATGAFAVVADFYNHAVRRLAVGTWRVTTLAGRKGAPGSADGTGGAARFYHPWGIAAAAGYAVLTDYKNHAVRRVDFGSGRVTTLAGSLAAGEHPVPGQPDPGAGAADSAKDDDNESSGRTARFWYPSAIALHLADEYALVADRHNHVLRRMSLRPPHKVRTIAGKAGAWGYADGVGGVARFEHPAGVATNSRQAYALVGDSRNNALRKLELTACRWSASPTPAPAIVFFSQGQEPSPAPVPTPLSSAPAAVAAGGAPAALSGLLSLGLLLAQ